MSRVSPFGDPGEWPDQDLVGVSTAFSAEIVLAGYLEGLFPMPLGGQLNAFAAEVGWFSPMQRAVLPLDGLRVSRSLRKSARHFRVSVDQAFAAVLAGCADPAREHGWIDDGIVEAYTELHRLGVVHSVETWTPSGELAGGLYGVALGGLFAGESMFHHPEVGRDASKVALGHLVTVLGGAEPTAARLLDVQWQTDHLASLGAVELSREHYLDRLAEVLPAPGPDWAAARAAGRVEVIMPHAGNA